MNRARRIDAPGPVLPGSHAKTLAVAVNEFNAVRKETVRFVEEFNGELRSWLTIHPLITRPVNCYEMLLLLAMHPKRHALQIIEAREAARRMAELDLTEATGSLMDREGRSAAGIDQFALRRRRPLSR